jgi:hypothetical protein
MALTMAYGLRNFARLSWDGDKHGGCGVVDISLTLPLWVFA